MLPLPAAPLGSDVNLADLPEPPTPARVRLGRSLFFDNRLLADGTVSCATCHQPEHAFSQPTAVSTGIGGQVGRRKAPSFVNGALTLYPHFFWDGWAASLEDQARGPVANPIEMGNTRPYFAEAFGSDEVTKDRIAKALADYERTRISGNSPYDRWRRQRDQSAVPDAVKRGH